MPFAALPASAAWLHQGARCGFEVVFFRPVDGGLHLAGCTAAAEAGTSWIVDYELEVDASWRTRRAGVRCRSDGSRRSRLLEADRPGRWRVDGLPAPNLAGCLDVDLEFSAMTNTLPVHRLSAAGDERSMAPAAYVRAPDLSVERLEQTYVRSSGEDGRPRYAYAAPAFDFACELVFDEAGVVLVYPGIAVRAG